MTRADSIDEKSMGELQRENRRLRHHLQSIRDCAWKVRDDFAENAPWDDADLLHELAALNGLCDLVDLACECPYATVLAASPAVVENDHGKRNPITPPAVVTNDRRCGAPAARQLPLEV